MPWYALALMLIGPCALGVARIAIAVLHVVGWKRDPRPGYIDLSGRRPSTDPDAKLRHT